MLRILLALVLLLLPATSLARTWHVEKDGSGDYSVIQDAVDIAASGDTIRIGPGYYNDWKIYGASWENFHIRVYITQQELTLIGSGDRQTSIGQGTPWDQEQGTQQGLSVSENCRILRVENICFENLKHGLVAGYGEVAEIRNCLFRANEISIGIAADRGTIEECRFYRALRSGQSILSYFQTDLSVLRCICETDVVNSYDHVHIEGPSTVRIEQCEFRGARGGVMLSQGPHAIIRDCIFQDQSSFAISLATGGPICEVTDSVFRSQRAVFFGPQFPDSELRIERITVENVSYATLDYQRLERGYIRDSILAKGAGGVAVHWSLEGKESEIAGRDSIGFDMSDNWWGTTDPDSIRAWIYDGNDDPRIDYYINFEPFKTEPVAVEEKSMGDLKAMFRGR